MKKVYYLLTIVASILFVNTFSSYAKDLPSVGSIAWVNKKIQQYPELLWLADNTVRKTQQDVETKTGESPSEILWGQKYAEFDRSILSLMVLAWVNEGSKEAYEALTKDQTPADKLSFESFLTLHKRYKKIITSLKDFQDFEISLILGDMGKSKIVRDQFLPLGVTAPDHDDFIREALQKDPTIFPSFSKLSPWTKKVLPQVSGLVHFGHVTHLEGGQEMLKPLKDSDIAKKNPKALEFDFLVHLADVAGSMGHVNPATSLVLIQDTYNALMAVDTALRLLKDKPIEGALKSYIDTRAQWLGVNAQESKGRTLTRLGAMLRLFGPANGKVLTEAFQKFTPEEQKAFTNELDPLSLDLPLITPTYIPAVLVNLSNNKTLGETKEARLQQSVELGIPFISVALKEYKKLLKDHAIENPTAPLNFNDVARVAKETPEKLKDKKFTIDAENTVKVID